MNSMHPAGAQSRSCFSEENLHQDAWTNGWGGWMNEGEPTGDNYKYKVKRKKWMCTQKVGNERRMGSHRDMRYTWTFNRPRSARLSIVTWPMTSFFLALPASALIPFHTALAPLRCLLFQSAFYTADCVKKPLPFFWNYIALKRINEISRNNNKKTTIFEEINKKVKRMLLHLFTPTNTLMLDEYTSNFQHVFIYQLAGTDGCRLQKYVLLILVVIFLKYFRLPEPSVAIANYCYLLIITPSRRSTDLLGRLWR